MYENIAVRENAQVKMRRMVFLEINESGLIEKAISVFDESVINTTLSAGLYLYS